jgi:hypothetical protein
MADKTTDGVNDAETVDGKSLGKANNPISRATLVMIAGTILFIIIATVIFISFFKAPTGKTGTRLTDTKLSIIT